MHALVTVTLPKLCDLRIVRKYRNAETFAYVRARSDKHRQLRTDITLSYIRGHIVGAGKQNFRHPSTSVLGTILNKVWWLKWPT